MLLATGLNAGNTLITSGSVADAHWTVDQIGGGTAPAVTVYPNNADWQTGWATNGESSDWIARNANTSDNGPASYSFFRTFDLTGFQPLSAFISGSWAIDDAGTLKLNGTTVSTLGAGAYTDLTNFLVPIGSPLFLPGTNTLSITITSSDDNKEGVRLQGIMLANLLNVGATPEPGSMALFGSAAVTVIGVGLKRKRQTRRAQ